MRTFWSMFAVVVLLVGYTVTPAVAHWDPGDDYKMHYPQLGRLRIFISGSPGKAIW